MSRCLWGKLSHGSTNPDNVLALAWSGFIPYLTTQGRIYVANEYPTFTKTMLMVGQKLTFSHQII